jgi:hypothetical protein
MKVECTNDSGRPNEIPSNKWIKKGELYTVIGIIKCNIQKGALALILEEIDLSDCEPFKGFNAERFNCLKGEFTFRVDEIQSGLVESNV